MEITVNLANQPYTDARAIIRILRISICATAIVTSAVAFATYSAHQKAQEVRAKSKSLESSIDALRGEQHAYGTLMRSSATVAVGRQADELNQIFDAKAFSWTGVMKDLETVLPAGVQVTAIEPMRAKDGNTILHLRVVGPHAKSIDLLQHLEAAKRFLQPRIVGEALANGEGAGHTNVPVEPSTLMEFDLLVEYNADAPDLPLLEHEDRAVPVNQAAATRRPSPSKPIKISASATTPTQDGGTN